MRISYAITVCNEHKEIEKLLTFLFKHKRPNDQVVVQMDKDNVTDEVWNVCESFENRQATEYSLIQCSLNKNFAVCDDFKYLCVKAFGVPWPIIRPPSLPPSGPISIM